MVTQSVKPGVQYYWLFCYTRQRRCELSRRQHCKFGTAEYCEYSFKRSLLSVIICNSYSLLPDLTQTNYILNAFKYALTVCHAN